MKGNGVASTLRYLSLWWWTSGICTVPHAACPQPRNKKLISAPPATRASLIRCCAALVHHPFVVLYSSALRAWSCNITRGLRQIRHCTALHCMFRRTKTRTTRIGPVAARREHSIFSFLSQGHDNAHHLRQQAWGFSDSLILRR
ncbi:hypothetical protein F4801DRAFT_541543 [Xylaria longipes]|nr:hypothetical protein F4801DRAFT_541543 [Xylaria longipes]